MVVTKSNLNISTIEGQHQVVHRSWNRPRPVIDHGEGIYLYDKSGKRYIDGSSGTSVVVNLGHGATPVIEAMYKQAQKVAFASPHYFTNEPMLVLGQMIKERAPGEMRNNCRTWFSCTGTDSVDDACRLARQYSIANGMPTKYVIISRWQQFHGNQIGMAGVAGHTARRRMLYPMFVNSPHIPPAYCYRCYFGDTYPSCKLKCAWALETEIRQTGEENVAAFIAEPVVGASLGALPAPDGYFDVIREICDRYKVLLMVDEVMTAWGRVGSWFAMDYYGITPDVISTSKGLTAGYTPLAATISRENIWQVIEDSKTPFMAGHTVTETPTATAAAVATLNYIEEHDIITNSRETGAYLLNRMQELLDFDIVGDVRGRGFMCGVEIVKDKETKEPFPPSKKACLVIMNEAVSHGLLLFPCTGNVDGVAGDMVLITPPLITTRTQVDEIIDLTKQAIAAAQVQLFQ
jgi:adenosylmethionine-8-amino-7-oxononanoate aminotransferase